MIKEISEGVKAIHFQKFGCIVYLVEIRKEKIIIDTSSKDNKEELIFSLKELNLTPEDITTVILTHAHYDHIENIDIFSNAKVYANFTESIEADHSRKPLKNILPVKDQPIKEFQIYNTPGHTSEDIVMLYKNILFSGDLVFHEGYIGRTDFPESLPNEMQNSLKLAQNLKFDVLCPGH